MGKYRGVWKYRVMGKYGGGGGVWKYQVQVLERVIMVEMSAQVHHDLPYHLDHDLGHHLDHDLVD